VTILKTNCIKKHAILHVMTR